MTRYIIIAFALFNVLGCTPIIDSFQQVPGDGPSTDNSVSHDAGFGAGGDAGVSTDPSGEN